ncbi:uncharacterized protein LOC133707928 [Rosa rugosa]|uniref:uncharacterized protein LOC133707928 n=1 Tax=Rosa rugosa TaxID=74645 RepID=UPI002B416A17|nr:uncharacterized protein LOC133707928 [Rosa rugosa]
MALNRNPAMAAMLLGLLLLMHGPTSALALSGGAVGGGSFSSGGSSSSSSSSSSSRYYDSGDGSSSSSSSSMNFIIWIIIGFIAAAIAFFPFVFVIACCCKIKGEKCSSFSTSVLKLQVGLLGSAPTLQTDLNRIAETADTSTSQGWSNVLAGATISLLQNLDYCISGYSSVALKQTIQDAEKYFNQLSITERAICDKETLVNVNNIKVKSSTSKAATGSQSEYITVTILVATRGLYKLPTVDDSSTLKQALQNLKSIPSNKILSVQVLWTPQEEDDNLSEQQLLNKYPLLKPFKDYPLVEVTLG